MRPTDDFSRSAHRRAGAVVPPARATAPGGGLFVVALLGVILLTLG